jgi:hypothetical protein
MANGGREVKKLLAAFLVAFSILGYSATAEANGPPSTHYCELSLLGGGSLAPDNDIKRRWNWYENNYGVNIVAAFWTGAYYTGAHVTNMLFVYKRANGSAYYLYASCSDYRNEFVGGTYHDDA